MARPPARPVPSTTIRSGRRPRISPRSCRKQRHLCRRSKGKGFQGTIRRHNFHRGPVSHGSHNVRAPGSIGASATPARVLKGIRMPGQMGNRRVTQRGLEVVDVDPERNLLIVKGAVPGPTGGLVMVRSSVKTGETGKRHH